MSSMRGSVAADLIYAYRTAGRKTDAARLIAELEAKSGKEYVSNTDFAMAYGAIGDREKAIEYLEKAFSERSSQLRLNMKEPHFDDIRSDPRFANFLKKLGINTSTDP
jgi:tetratricopeptide (TPR) repeat protein